MAYFDNPVLWEAWLAELDELREMREQRRLYERQGVEDYYPESGENDAYYEEEQYESVEGFSELHKNVDNILRDDDYYFNIKNRQRIENVFDDDETPYVEGAQSVLDMSIPDDILDDDSYDSLAHEDIDDSFLEDDDMIDPPTAISELTEIRKSLQKAIKGIDDSDIEALGILSDPEFLLEDSDLPEENEGDEHDIDALLDDDITIDRSDD